MLEPLAFQSEHLGEVVQQIQRGVGGDEQMRCPVIAEPPIGNAGHQGMGQHNSPQIAAMEGSGGDVHGVIRSANQVRMLCGLRERGRLAAASAAR